MTKEEQEKDFKEVISSRTDKDCKICFGKGYQGWNQVEERFVPCTCVMKNIQNELAGNNEQYKDKKGIFSNIRHNIGLN